MRRVSYPKAPYAAARRHHSTPIIAVPRTIPRSARPLRRAACPDAIGIAPSLFPTSLRRAACPDAIGIASSLFPAFLRRFVASSPLPSVASSLRRCSHFHVLLRKNRTSQTNPFAASLTPLTRIPPPKMASFSARRPGGTAGTCRRPPTSPRTMIGVLRARPVGLAQTIRNMASRSLPGR